MPRTIGSSIATSILKSLTTLIQFNSEPLVNFILRSNILIQ